MLLWVDLQKIQAFRGSRSEQNAALTLREHLALQEYFSHPRFAYLFIVSQAPPINTKLALQKSKPVLGGSHFFSKNL
jgi:hypothetical protein